MGKNSVNGGISKMAKKKKEQLEEVVEDAPKEEVSTEEVKEETKEEPVKEADATDEESKEEPKAEESPAEEKPVEEKIEKVEDLEVEDEQLSKEIKETKEEIFVIKEVREELVKLYGDFKESEQLKNDAEAKNEQLTKDVEALSAKLNDYIVAEEKLKAEQQLQRLEKLSAKFAALGQSKSVEHLSSKDAETLSEFEKIVDAALSKVGDTTEMPAVTGNMQTEKLNDEAKSEEDKPSEPAPEKPKEQLSKEKFFENICNTMADQQNGGSGKRAKLM